MSANVNQCHFAQNCRGCGTCHFGQTQQMTGTISHCCSRSRHHSHITACCSYSWNPEMGCWGMLVAGIFQWPALPAYHLGCGGSNPKRWSRATGPGSECEVEQGAVQAWQEVSEMGMGKEGATGLMEGGNRGEKKKVRNKKKKGESARPCKCIGMGSHSPSLMLTANFSFFQWKQKSSCICSIPFAKCLLFALSVGWGACLSLFKAGGSGAIVFKFKLIELQINCCCKNGEQLDLLSASKKLLSCFLLLI